MPLSNCAPRTKFWLLFLSQALAQLKLLSKMFGKATQSTRLESVRPNLHSALISSDHSTANIHNHDLRTDSAPLDATARQPLQKQRTPRWYHSEVLCVRYRNRTAETIGSVLRKRGVEVQRPNSLIQASISKIWIKNNNHKNQNTNNL